jgi:hypothetical protein
MVSGFNRSPWTVRYDHENESKAIRVQDESGRAVAFPAWTDFENAEIASNARLIASAPDMYEALSSIENDAGQVPAWLWDKISAAIAKAEGTEAPT